MIKHNKVLGAYGWHMNNDISSVILFLKDKIPELCSD